MAAELNQTPSASRLHIGFFGRRNAGKSSVINALTGQEISIVSDVKGTTTDPVSKAMEILPIGPVILIDTPGVDDEGDLGSLRVKRSYRVLNKCDVALLVVDATEGKNSYDEGLISLFKEKNIPYITLLNKADLVSFEAAGENELYLSAVTGEGIDKLKEKLIAVAASKGEERRIIGDKITAGDVVVLVTPIDGSAPKGRMILPQMQAVRDVLDSHAVCVVTQTEELAKTLSTLAEKPKFVITDSQAFGKVKDIVPEDVPLTSFSILMASVKGILEGAIHGVLGIEKLKEGSRVLICEGCTHHRQCEDIGTVKLPSWICAHTGIESLSFEFTSGGQFPESLEKYDLVIHCGGCMLGEREVSYRAKCAADAGVPFTNYGTAIAYMNGILKRSLSPFPDLQKLI